MSILGEHKSFKGKTFDSIEQREGRIRAALEGMRCTAFRPWGEYRFGSFDPFSQDEPSCRGSARSGRSWLQKVRCTLLNQSLLCPCATFKCPSTKNQIRDGNTQICHDKQAITATSGLITTKFFLQFCQKSFMWIQCRSTQV